VVFEVVLLQKMIRQQQLRRAAYAGFTDYV
jgi:hypothetical protein